MSPRRWLLILWIGFLALPFTGCETLTAVSPATQVSQEAGPAVQIVPSPAPSLTPENVAPAERYRAVRMSLSSEVLPAEVTLDLLINNACTLQRPVKPIWSGSVVMPEVMTNCAAELAPDMTPETVSFQLNPTGFQPGFYILELNELRQPFTISAAQTLPVAPTAVLETGSSIITGRVWHDICRNQVQNTELIDGCIRRGADDQLIANGRIDENEEGIPFISVILWSGECGNILLGAAQTDRVGAFRFEQLPAGRYCIELDLQTASNSALLTPGQWSTPPSGNGLSASYTVDLDGVGLNDQVLFGWDFALLPRLSAEDSCQNKVWLEAGGLLPAGSEVLQNEEIIKSWQVQNIGTCSWSSEYQLAPLDKDGVVDLEAAVEIGREIAPGASVELSLTLIAPERLGRWQQRWIMLDDKNTPFGVGLTEQKPLLLDLEVISP
ncbi:MAG: NBR1-Ig-like domain-containing protein [Ardenticatenaceae bacterium]|nr:NBR1-Ig-like domain-containing protein [Ardenticatenaceae bacterium]